MRGYRIVVTLALTAGLWAAPAPAVEAQGTCFGFTTSSPGVTQTGNTFIGTNN